MMTQGTGRNKLQIKEWGKGTQENVRVSRANGNTWGTFFFVVMWKLIVQKKLCTGTRM